MHGPDRGPHGMGAAHDRGHGANDKGANNKGAWKVLQTREGPNLAHARARKRARVFVVDSLPREGPLISRHIDIRQSAARARRHHRAVIKLTSARTTIVARNP